MDSKANLITFFIYIQKLFLNIIMFIFIIIHEILIFVMDFNIQFYFAYILLYK